MSGDWPEFSPGATHAVASLKDMSPQALGELQQFFMQQFSLQQAQGKLQASKVIGAVGAEQAYTEFTSNVTITATTEGTANTIVTATAFTADGTSAYLIEFFSPDVFANNAETVTLALYQDGSSIGKIAVYKPQGTGGVTGDVAAYVTRRYIAASGSHTYSIRGFSSASTSSAVKAGSGSSGNLLPGFVRITKVT